MTKFPEKLTTDHLLKYASRLKGAHRYDFGSTVYHNMRTPIKFTCLEHGVIKCMPSAIIHGYGCPMCGALYHGERRQLTLDQYKTVASTVHKNKYDYSSVTAEEFKLGKFLSVKCPKHGMFETRKSAHIVPKQQYGCPKCAKGQSKTELWIEEWLTLHEIEYETQKTFSGLKNGKTPLPFDFFIPSLNLLIEFDGMHHYKPVRFSKTQTMASAEAKFRSIKANDKRKELHAAEEGIDLLVIHCKRTKDLDAILMTELLGTLPIKPIDTPLITTTTMSSWVGKFYM